MRIGFIGTGRMAHTLARLWADRGHSALLGSRTPQKVDADLGSRVTVGSWREAAQFGPVLVLAFPWHALTDVVRGVGPLPGKLLIDMINPIMSSGSLALGHKTSAAETIARSWPGSRVVKAFNHLYWEALERPLYDGVPADFYYCGDDDAAREVVASLGASLGFRPVDCGPLRQARLLEPLALLWITLAFQFGRGPGFAFKLISRSA